MCATRSSQPWSVIEGRALTHRERRAALEALLHLPDGEPPFPGVVICHPHPQFGGDMYNNVVGALVRAALGVGVAALRFNFRGVGESEGAYDDGNGEPDDVRAALDFMRSQPEIDPKRVGPRGLLLRGDGGASRWPAAVTTWPRSSSVVRTRRSAGRAVEMRPELPDVIRHRRPRPVLRRTSCSSSTGTSSATT